LIKVTRKGTSLIDNANLRLTPRNTLHMVVANYRGMPRVTDWHTPVTLKWPYCD
jgi:hypothetical protein